MTGLRTRGVFKTAWFDAGWAIIALALCALLPYLMEQLWILAFIPVLGVFAVGLLMLVVRLWGARHPANRSDNLRSAGRLFAVMVGVFVLAGPAQSFGARTLVDTRFRLHRNDYDSVVEYEKKYRATRPPARSIAYRLDSGPELRIAFPNPDGLLDNWCATVYDPSKLVMRANEFRSDWSNWDDPELRPVKELFGGDLRSCRPLEGPYFHCCFT